MPLDKHNSRMARARDLMSSLINVASSQNVPFHQPQQLQCLHHGATFVLLWSPILSSQPREVTIWGRHIMASVQDTKVTEPLLILCLAYYAMNEFNITPSQFILFKVYPCPPTAPTSTHEEAHLIQSSRSEPQLKNYLKWWETWG